MLSGWFWLFCAHIVVTAAQNDNSSLSLSPTSSNTLAPTVDNGRNPTLETQSQSNSPTTIAPTCFPSPPTHSFDDPFSTGNPTRNPSPEIVNADVRTRTNYTNVSQFDGDPFWDTVQFGTDKYTIEFDSDSDEKTTSSLASDSRWRGQVVSNKLVLGIPFDAPCILVVDCFDFDRGLFSGVPSLRCISLSNQTNVTQKAKWDGAVEVNGTVFGVPFSVPKILMVRVANVTRKQIVDWNAPVDSDYGIRRALGLQMMQYFLDLPLCVTWASGAFSGAVYHPPSDSLVLIPYNAVQVVTVDVRDMNIKCFGRSSGVEALARAGGRKWSGGTISPGAMYVYATPYEAKSILQIDPARGEVSLIQAAPVFSFFGRGSLGALVAYNSSAICFMIPSEVDILCEAQDSWSIETLNSDWPRESNLSLSTARLPESQVILTRWSSEHPLVVSALGGSDVFEDRIQELTEFIEGPTTSFGSEIANKSVYYYTLQVRFVQSNANQLVIHRAAVGYPPSDLAELVGNTESIDRRRPNQERSTVRTNILAEKQSNNLIYLIVLGMVLGVLCAAVILASKCLWRDKDGNYTFLLFFAFGLLDFCSDVFLIYTVGETLQQLPELRGVFYFGCSFLTVYSIVSWISAYALLLRASRRSLKMASFLRRHKIVVAFAMLFAFAKPSSIRLLETRLFTGSTGCLLPKAWFSAPISNRARGNVRTLQMLGMLLEEGVQGAIVLYLQGKYLGGWTTLNIVSFSMTVSVIAASVSVNLFRMQKQFKINQADTKSETQADSLKLECNLPAIQLIQI